MIIRRDNMGHSPPMAPISAATRDAASKPTTTAAPNTPVVQLPATEKVVTERTLAHVYPLNPIQHREEMQREAWEKERALLIKTASNSQGEQGEQMMANILSI